MKLNNLHRTPKDEEEGKKFLGRHRTRGGRPPSPKWVTGDASFTGSAKNQESEKARSSRVQSRFNPPGLTNA